MSETGFQRFLRSCAFDESSLSIARTNRVPILTVHEVNAEGRYVVFLELGEGF